MSGDDRVQERWTDETLESNTAVIEGEQRPLLAVWDAMLNSFKQR
ncbi:hypothetical protein [Burkholderia ubonensis]|nr:hypothetical protein [Burkholderia ubonensis]